MDILQACPKEAAMVTVLSENDGGSRLGAATHRHGNFGHCTRRFAIQQGKTAGGSVKCCVVHHHTESCRKQEAGDPFGERHHRHEHGGPCRPTCFGSGQLGDGVAARWPSPRGRPRGRLRRSTTRSTTRFSPTGSTPSLSAQAARCPTCTGSPPQ